MWGIAFSIVNARSKKLLKRLVATPMSKTQYFLSHLFSRLVTLTLEVVVILGFAWMFFDVTPRGSLALVAVLALGGALAFGGMGLLVASRVKTIEAVSGLTNQVLMPMWVLSGVFFASSNFPDAMQPVIQALPLTALNDALRGVINEGRSMSGIANEIAVLAAWGSLSFVAALKLFRWQ